MTRVSVEGVSSSGTNVEVFRNSLSIQKFQTGINGELLVYLPIVDSVTYLVVISKPKYISKSFEINTSHVPKQRCKIGFTGFSIREVTLTKQLLGVNYNALKAPILQIYYDPLTHNFNFDKVKDDKNKDNLIDLKKNEAEMAKLQDSIKDVEIRNGDLKLKLSEIEMQKLNSDFLHKQSEKEKEVLILSEKQKINELNLLKNQTELIRKELERKKIQHEVDALNQSKKVQEYEIAQQKSDLVKKELISKKNDQEIELLNKDKLVKEAELKSQTTQRYSLYAGILLALLFSVFVANRLKVSQNQRKIIALQKQNVEQKQKEILDSISYAKRLQQAILPSDDLVKSVLPESFIFYQPKDIVAGDFYWMYVSEQMENDSNVLIAAADCTGHGVPGAMVSIVCSTALNRAVNEFDLSDPGEILDKTRELVLETFSKSSEDVKDGMDISLAFINKKTRQVKWSGANNSLWYVTNDTIERLVPNKQPIGKTENPSTFTSHSLLLNSGDFIFLFTDGFADQFGGPKGKKFMYKQLADFLKQNAKLKPEIQKEKLLSKFNEWKGNLDQVDDICIIGIGV
ncbi:MAG TPA: SpoIIE family protein phosphatase [Bacteroidia bacterium]|nr:SpoIIE family protein phosphatase [Bacteroidia bacterium]